MENENIDPARVRKRRDDLGISQPELAARIAKAGFGKLAYQSVQQLEDGSIKKPRYAMYLAAALDTTWEYLTGKTDNPAPPQGNILKDLSRFGESNGSARPEDGAGQEGTQVLMEISRMLGSVEGSLKSAFNARFDIIDMKMDDHDRRLDALEERVGQDPRKGRRR